LLGKKRRALIPAVLDGLERSAALIGVERFRHHSSIISKAILFTRCQEAWRWVAARSKCGDDCRVVETA
jgi:hypothetical protein